MHPVLLVACAAAGHGSIYIFIDDRLVATSGSRSIACMRIPSAYVHAAAIYGCNCVYGSLHASASIAPLSLTKVPVYTALHCSMVKKKYT